MQLSPTRRSMRPTVSGPRFRPKRQIRRYRLLRTAGVALALLALILFIIGRLSGNSGPGPARLKFETQVLPPQSDVRTAGPSDVDAEARAVTSVLEDWFQSAFIDPKRFADGRFEDAMRNFSSEARRSFRQDVATLTIGPARTELSRVVPELARARIAMFLEGGSTSRFAIADITFRARGIPNAQGNAPLRIQFTGRVTLERQDRWLVTLYEAKQTQNTVQRTAERSPS